jgi:hypothetical protein
MPVSVPDVNEVHHTAKEMDDIRQRNMAYEYLCHLEEAKMLEIHIYLIKLCF